MINSYEAFIKRVKIDDTFYIVPLEVEKKLRDLDEENEELRAKLAQEEAMRNADEFERASMIICNLKSDRMGTSKVLSNMEFGILDDYWAELEGRIVHGLRGEYIDGQKYRPDMIPRISGADADAFIQARRKAQHINDKYIGTIEAEPKERRKKNSVEIR